MSDNPYQSLLENGGNAKIFRARGALAYTVLGYFFCAGMFYTAFTESSYSTRADVFFAAIMIFLSLAVYTCIQRPSILFTDLGIGIKNPFSTIVLDWCDVKDLETKFVLTIDSKYGPIRCWAAVGPSRSQHRRIHPGDLRGPQRASLEIKAADSLKSDSGVAAHIARIRVGERRNYSGDHVEYRWERHNSTLIAFSVSAFAALAGLFAL